MKSKSKKGKSKSSRVARTKLSLRQILIFAITFIVIGLATLLYSHAASSPYDTARQSKLVNNPHRGLVYDGLLAVKANADHPCHGMFEASGAKVGGMPVCTHGPDPAPEGVDPTKVTVAGTIERISKTKKTHLSESQIKSLNPYKTSDITAYDLAGPRFTNPIPASPMPCGTSGKLVQLMVVYDHRNGAYDPHVTALMQGVAGRMETQVRASAVYSGPNAQTRSIRFATIADCSTPTVGVNDFALSADPSFNEIKNDLVSRGYNRADRKYLVWIDHSSSLCGQGTAYNDSQLTLNNAANVQTGYAMVGPVCWSTQAELHELMHTLGGVQNDAPHTTGAFHCIDEHDEMCRPDGAGGKAYNGKAIYISPTCTSLTLQYFLDCNHDDYFTTNPAILLPTSHNYLHSHWNTALSGWLNRF